MDNTKNENKKDKMLVKPNYYDEFKCIAGECRFTCCMAWDIAVDNKTLSKWKKLGMCTKNYVRKKDGNYIIRLNEEKVCPLLQKDKLCKMVVEHGEDMISKTCHTFPREQHEFLNRTEYTLTMGCPAALDLLWAKDDFRYGSEKQNYEKLNSENDDFDEQALFYLRDRFCELMQDERFKVYEALKIMFYIILNIDEEDENLIKQIDEFLKDENLMELKTAISALPRDYYSHISEQNELFLDLAENYRKKKLYNHILEPLANKAEEYENEDENKFVSDRKEFETVWEKFSVKVRKLMAEEVYSTLYLPEGDLYSMTLKLQWMGIFYAVLKQCIFLEWENKKIVTDEVFTDILVTLIRMTGYSEADIEEYLENSFEDIVWDWSYMAYIL